jgi:plastocyanin
MTRASLALRLTTLALGLSAAVPALGAGGTITGKVEATPPKYLEDTVVYLKEVPGSFPKRTEKMDQKGMKFVPHVLTVTKGDTVDFLNHDNVAHNVYSPDNEGYNLGTFKQNETRTHVFDKAGTYSQLCSIHPEMLGYIFVGQNPYAAAVDAKGHYAIKDVPAGTYQLEVWNAKLKAPAKSVTVAAGQTLTENLTLKR